MCTSLMLNEYRVMLIARFHLLPWLRMLGDSRLSSIRLHCVLLNHKIFFLGGGGIEAPGMEVIIPRCLFPALCVCIFYSCRFYNSYFFLRLKTLFSLTNSRLWIIKRLFVQDKRDYTVQYHLIVYSYAFCVVYERRVSDDCSHKNCALKIPRRMKLVCTEIVFI